MHLVVYEVDFQKVPETGEGVDDKRVRIGWLGRSLEKHWWLKLVGRSPPTVIDSS